MLITHSLAGRINSYLFVFSFGLRHWFKFGMPVVSSPPSFDVDTEVSMVEGMLTLLVTLLSTRLHLGNNDILFHKCMRWSPVELFNPAIPTEILPPSPNPD